MNFRKEIDKQGNSFYVCNSCGQGFMRPQKHQLENGVNCRGGSHA